MAASTGASSPWWANLFRANLQGANIFRANLQGASLWGANLHEDNLDGADLTKAKNLHREQLDEACGDDETKVPDDQFYYSMKPCPTR